MIIRTIVSLLLLLPVLTNTLTGQSQPVSKSWQQPGEQDSLVVLLLPSNSAYNDFSPIFINNILYFSSDRKNRHTDEAALSYNQNIYYSRYQDKIWRNPRKNYYFNNDDFSALAGCSHDRSIVYIYKTFGNGDIYFSQQNNRGKWKRPKQLRWPINSQMTEQSLVTSERIVVVSSNRGDGIQFDLYWGWYFPDTKMIELLPLHQANTSGNEIDVSLSSDGTTLYFSSDGRKNESDFDIYFMKIDNKGNWSLPEKLGYDVNTQANERWFLDCDSVFFFSSDRQGGQGKLDNYFGHLIPRKIQPKSDTIPDIQQDSTIVYVPDATATDQIEKIENFLDSVNFEVYVAYVQIGAFYFIKTVEEFKKRFTPFAQTDIFIEKEETPRGTLHKFIINEPFKTLAEASVRQKEALAKQAENNIIHKDKLKEDAFIAVYNKQNERILIYFDVATRKYKILMGDKVVYF